MYRSMAANQVVLARLKVCSAWFAIKPLVIALMLFSIFAAYETRAEGLRVAVFSSDATPPLGTNLPYTPMRSVTDPLQLRGIVVLGSGKPIVLAALDWVSIGGETRDEWHRQLAAAAGTSVDRVSVHVLHQHDGPRSNMSAERMLYEHGLMRSTHQLGGHADHAFVRRAIADSAEAVRNAMMRAVRVTHVGAGQAPVEKVASNRRILGPDGKVTLFRMTAWTMAPQIYLSLHNRGLREGYRISPDHPQEAEDAAEGVIDPLMRLVSFWNGDNPVAILSYYATHPQSYYGFGDASADFPGIARERRSQETGVPHIHFTGAGGNIGAGKYNDGSVEARRVLTERMADGMRRAWAATERTPVSANDVEWRVARVKIPPRFPDAAGLERTLNDTTRPLMERSAAASRLTFLQRVTRSDLIELSALRIGRVHLLHMPGELFVEYQLAAQALRPNDMVCMAAYGEALGYIGTAAAYAEGGYETDPGASRTAPAVEAVLMSGIRELLR
jgi:hypothetical protein